MSAPNTTPGPWRVVFYDAGDCDYYDHNGPCPGIFAPDDQDCAVVHWDGFKQQYWSSANGNQRQIEANAHLIAAAPELYEALEWLTREADGWSGQIEPPLPSLANAWAVLARARGEQS